MEGGCSWMEEVSKASAVPSQSPAEVCSFLAFLILPPQGPMLGGLYPDMVALTGLGGT